MDKQHVILEAFQELDAGGTGSIDSKLMRQYLQHISPIIFTDHNIDRVLEAVGGIQSRGRVNYEELVTWLFQDECISDFNRSSLSKVEGVPTDMKASTDVGHKFRGVSPHYLASGLVEEMRFEGVSRTAKVYEIEPVIIRPKGALVICPRDGRLGAAFVDCVHGVENAGLSKFMLSYTWGYEVGDIVDTLMSFCKQKGLDEKNVYFWICCLCINQHRVKEAHAKGEVVPFDAFRQDFGDRVEGIGQLVAMMAPWHQPVYITRVWCCFETFTALSLGSDRCTVHVAMPPDQARAMLSALGAEDGIEKMWQALAGLKVENANASVEEDKIHILNLISADSGGPGFHTVNSAVAKYLQTWAVENCCTEFDRSLANASEGADRLSGMLGELLCKIGQFTRATQVLERGIELQGKSGTSKTAHGATLLKLLGTARWKVGDLNVAMSKYEEAMGIQIARGALNTAETASLVKQIGGLRHELGDNDGALAAYKESIAIFRNLGASETPEVAALLNNIGRIKHVQREFEEAMEFYADAKALREKTNTLTTPEGAMLLGNMGSLIMLGGDLRRATAVLEEAMAICEQTATLEALSGTSVLMNLGIVKRHCGDLDSACIMLERGCALCRKIGVKETSEYATMLGQLGFTAWQQEDTKRAMVAFEQAKTTFEKIGALNSTNGRILMGLLTALSKELNGDLRGALACQELLLRAAEQVEMAGSDIQFLRQKIEFLKFQTGTSMSS